MRSSCLRTWISTKEAEKKASETRLQELDEERREAEASKEAVAQAIDIMGDIITSVQEDLEERLTSMVNRIMSEVFDHPYRLRILFEAKGSKMESRLVFERDGEQFDDLMEQVAGGALDLAAFALRLSVLVLQGGAKVLVFDEPFRFLARDRREILADILEKISQEAGIQIIMVTHHPELAIGKVIEIP